MVPSDGFKLVCVEPDRGAQRAHVDIDGAVAAVWHEMDRTLHPIATERTRDVGFDRMDPHGLPERIHGARLQNLAQDTNRHHAPLA